MDLSNNIVKENSFNNEFGYLSFKVLDELGIFNGVTTREGGNDFRITGEFKDNGENKKRSYERLYKYTGFPKEKVITIIQKHTDNVYVIDNPEDVIDNCDAVITNKKGILLKVSIADCTPVFIYDKKTNALGDIHSGWKGTVQRISEKTAKLMNEVYGSQYEDMIVCIGPCIGKDHFEVQDDVKEIFENEFKELKAEDFIFDKGLDENGVQKYLIDTSYVIKMNMINLGVKENNIYISDICTVCHVYKIHSHR
jgi:YfiH family protein